GFGVNVWTVNSLARANELFNWGATGIFTDVAHLIPRR
ncbi:MAG: glycerophosphoryl diester phosphodiesterase, partial [Varibaculum cambriense]|nr:glycerophosphoryl diester phosphodiesterase [Varibaculum cambriense]